MGGFNPRKADLVNGCRDLGGRLEKLDDTKDKEKLEKVSKLLKQAMQELEARPKKS